MTESAYSEIRPAMTGEVVTDTLTVSGSDSIAGWTFAATLYDPAGAEVSGAVTAAVLDADDRTVTVTFAAQADSGEYRFAVRRTDDGNGLVVAWGVLDLTSPNELP